MHKILELVAKIPIMDPLNRLIEGVLFRGKIHQKIQSLLMLGKSKRQRRKLNSPVFVVGCPHSGTSVMLAILDSHSSINAIEIETYTFYRRSFLKIPEFHAWNKATLAKGNSRWAEKTAEHIGKLDKIFGYYPDAKVILMVRDGRDVACSVKKRTGNFDDGIQWWVKWNKVAIEYRNHPNVIAVHYEQLIAETEDTLQEILQHIDEPYEPQLLNFSSKDRTWFTGKSEKNEAKPEPTQQRELRNWQINQPLFDGRNRWQQEMSQEEHDRFVAAARTTMDEMGYNLDAPKQPAKSNS